MDIANLKFETFEKTVPEALDAIGASGRISEQKAVLIKPNLVNDSPHPITTSPETCEAVVNYVRKHSRAEIVIAEGCGSSTLETPEVMRRLGYWELSERLGVPLVDLNYGPVRKISDPKCAVFKELYLPEIAFSHYIISVPVLKRHSLAIVTGTLKNMMGFAQPEYFHSESHGRWKKSLFHGQIQESLIDLNRHLVPDLTVLDASVGMAEYHLGGAHCDPPVSRIVAGYNPWEIDREAAELLGEDWRKIEHIAAGLR